MTQTEAPQRGSVGSILAALRAQGIEPKQTANGWESRCPAHGGGTVAIAQGNRGAVLNCFSGCRYDDVMGALGLDIPDLFDDPPASPSQRAPRRIASPTSIPLGEAADPAPKLPELRQPTQAELERLAKLRGVTIEAVRRMADHGTLYTATHLARLAWVVGDLRGRSWRFRRMDGGLWYGERKSVTVEGTKSDWPMGLDVAPHVPAADSVELVEGEGDLVAAYQLGIWAERDGQPWGRPCAMAGGVKRIHAEALDKLAAMPAGVRIWPHRDKNGAGEKTAQAWRERLVGAGVKVTMARIPDGFGDLGNAVEKWNGGAL